MVRSKVTLFICSLVCLSALLRLLCLGNPFQSSENAGLAAEIIAFPGYLWMTQEHYGLLISFYLKFFVGLVSLLGVTITEFWWKAPIALLGILQVPLTYFFLKRMGCRELGSLCGAAFVSVLPLHVFLSRYLWGHEVLGVFFVTLAVWKLIDFLESPTIKTGFVASLFLGLYQISHGYILPFSPCIICIIVLYSPNKREKILSRLVEKYNKKKILLTTAFSCILLGIMLNKYILERMLTPGSQITSIRINALIIAMQLILVGWGLYLTIRRPYQLIYELITLLKSSWAGITLLMKKFVWVFPLLFTPLGYYPLRHILVDRGGIRHLGFHLLSHLPILIRTSGVALVLFFSLAIMVGGFSKAVRSKRNILFITCAILYLTPLFFCVPPTLAVKKGAYLLIGTYFLILYSSCVSDKIAETHKKLVVFLVWVCFFVTLWGTVESLFGHDQWFDPSYVKQEHGGIIDPGTKACGYLIRKYVHPSAKVLAIHQNIEPPNMFYYFNRINYAWFDLPFDKTIDKFLKMKDKVDMVICNEKQKSTVEADGSFHKKIVIFSNNCQNRVMLIYAKPEINIPSGNIVPKKRIELNRAFDKEYAIGWREIFFQKTLVAPEVLKKKG